MLVCGNDRKKDEHLSEAQVEENDNLNDTRPSKSALHALEELVIS